jgi:hypothetical protein
LSQAYFSISSSSLAIDQILTEAKCFFGDTVCTDLFMILEVLCIELKIINAENSIRSESKNIDHARLITISGVRSTVLKGEKNE